MIRVNNDWQPLFDEEQVKPYYLSLREFLKEQYSRYVIYPPMDEIFNCFVLTPLSTVKVVILGQDPYHERGEAMGLSFSVRENIKTPPSLLNIKKELENEGLLNDNWSSDLTRWAKQGVLLLNSTLTVREHMAASHQKRGWEEFTDRCIKCLNDDEKSKVFILWGSYARSKKSLITSNHHLILESPHPSPLSSYRGFFGNNHFKKANEFLRERNIKEIEW